MKTSQPTLRSTIELAETALVDFDRLASTQRIVPVEKEKIV